MNIRKAVMNLVLVASSATVFSPNYGPCMCAGPSIGVTVGRSSDSKAKPVTITYMAYNIAHGRGNNPLLDYPRDTARNFRLICSRPNLEHNLNSIAELINRSNPDILAINEADFVKDGFWSTWNFKTDVGEYFLRRLKMPYLVKGSKNVGANNFVLGTSNKKDEIVKSCNEYNSHAEIWLNYSMDDYYKIYAFHTGNALFSKFKVRMSKTIGFRRYMEFSLGSYTDSKLDVGGIPVRVITTHLDESEGDYQVRELLDAVNGSVENIIISGDFNSRPSSKTIRMLKDSGFTIVDAGYTYVPGKMTLDYIMVRGNIKIKSYNVVKSNNSDHYPIIAALEIRR